MSSRNFKSLFAPSCVAVIGASDRPHSVGATVIRNLLHGGFKGPIWPVNLKHRAVAGARAYAHVADLPGTADLAVICTPAAGVPRLISELGSRGTRAAIVLSAGLDRAADDGGTLGAAMLRAAAPFSLRILGPNCLGILVPGIGLNASFAHVGASVGSLSFVAQSGALTTAMLDWARSRGVGFSHFVSLGNAADIDFGDLLEYLGQAPNTRAILLYIESITSARKFMAAARAAARNKPVIVVKAGRTEAAARAATSHSGALAGSDAVYEAAFRRAGVLRVRTTRQLFEAAEILAYPKPYRGPRLAIVSNGGGPAVMATDALIGGGGQLAELSGETIKQLNACLPAAWSKSNPIDIVGDAPAERYEATLGPLLQDPNVDALLLIHSPTAIASAAQVAAACSPLLAGASRPALACWMGGESARVFHPPGPGAAVPSYSTAEEAVEAFMHVVRYQRAQALLTQTAPSPAGQFKPDTPAVRSIVARSLAESRAVLSEAEAKDVLAAYGIAVVKTRIAQDAAEAAVVAGAIGYPVALKILSPDITHKSDIGGVALDIASPAALQESASAMLRRCRELRPQARIVGFTVQEMVRRAGAHELLAGIAVDPTFGPTIVFGQGGTAVEVIGDRALGLPPLNRLLARDLIAQTRIYRLLQGYRSQPPADLDAVALALIKLAQLAIDVPEIVELDINPLLADEHGIVALDARIRLEPASSSPLQRLAIRPYPAELEEDRVCAGRQILLRPMRPEDLTQHRAFLARTTPEDRRTRFFAAVRQFPDAELAQVTQIDYEREMAFIATAPDPAGTAEILGVVRACFDSDNTEAEFAILVRSDLKRQGLGRALLRKLIAYCRARGAQRLIGEVLGDNTAMLSLAESLGFQRTAENAGVIAIVLELI